MSIYRILHLSDIHHRISTEDTESRIFRKELIEKIRQLSETARFDSIIVSGDVFSQGVFKEEDARSLRDTLWNMLLNHNPEAEIIIAPGNHDLDRSVQSILPGYNHFRKREDIINKMAVSSNDDEYDRFASIPQEDREILFDKAFEGQQKYIHDLSASDPREAQHFLKPNWKVYEGITLTNELGEVISSFGDVKIHFIILNTNGFAGQMVRGEEYRKIIQNYKEKAQAYRQNLHDKEADEIESEIARLQTVFIDEGSICVDERAVNEFGRMTLSKIGRVALETINRADDSDDVYIFIGHHGIKYLTRNMKMALSTALYNTRSPYYLCGHAHKADTKTEIVTSGHIVDELQAGTIHKDRWASSQYGFNTIEIEFSNGMIMFSSQQNLLISTHQNTMTWLSTFPVKRCVPKNKPTKQENEKQNIYPIDAHDSIKTYTKDNKKLQDTPKDMLLLKEKTDVGPAMIPDDIWNLKF